MPYRFISSLDNNRCRCWNHCRQQQEAVKNCKLNRHFNQMSVNIIFPALSEVGSIFIYVSLYLICCFKAFPHNPKTMKTSTEINIYMYTISQIYCVGIIIRFIHQSHINLLVIYLNIIIYILN